MGNHLEIIQIQDSIPKVEGVISPNKVIGGTIDLGRQTMELNSVREFDLDSIRLASKKPLPIIKTIPQIPTNDSLMHPVYNVVNKRFDFPQEKTLFDGFYFSPFEPQTQKSKKPVPTRQLENNDSLTITKEDALANKIVLSKRDKLLKGFNSTDWMLGVIIFSLFLFGWLRFGYGKFVNMAIQLAVSFFAARRMQEEANVLRSRIFGIMNILFFINLSLLITQWISYNQFTVPYFNGIGLFFAILVGIVTVYFFKGLILWLFDFLFLTKGVFTYYNSTVFIYNRMVGLFLLPIVSIIPFISQNATLGLFLAGLIVVVLFYGFRIFRGIQIGFNNKLSIFYLILYLCALEILPLLMVYKLVNNQQ